MNYDCVCVFDVCGCNMEHVWKSEDNFEQLVLSPSTFLCMLGIELQWDTASILFCEPPPRSKECPNEKFSYK